MSDALLDAAARAYALVCLSDGRVDWPEDRAFASRMAHDPSFSQFEREDLEAAAAIAMGSIRGEQSFHEVARAIARLVDAPEEREAVMRAARAAVVADGGIRDQEERALEALAGALGFDVSKA
ncbi:MAG: TerB family tellurite resistance protein [Hyphomonadaceae bacterium]|nr:TerB family tellurite resistance protein [Hyphomonadaceae bacterium]